VTTAGGGYGRIRSEENDIRPNAIVQLTRWRSRGIAGAPRKGAAARATTVDARGARRRKNR